MNACSGIVLLAAECSKTMTRRTVHFALCLLMGIFLGGILLLGGTLKWEIAFLGALGATSLMLVVASARRILLFVLTFTVPIYFEKALIVSPGNLSLANGAGVTLSDVLIMTLLVVFLANLSLQQVEIHFFHLITVSGFTWLLFSMFSLLAASDGQLVIIQLINMGKLLLLCWVVASTIRDEVDVAFVIGALMLCMLFQSLVGVYQGVTGHPVGLDFLGETTDVHQQQLSEGLVNRVQGTMGHPNSYAMYLSTLLPFALALLFSTARSSLKVLVSIALCLGGLGLVFSLSRSAWIDLLVVISIVLVLAVRRKRVSPKAAVLIAGATSLILIGLVLFGPDIILSRLTSNDQGSAYGRITLDQTALAMISDHPLVGVGLNNYTLASPQYDVGVRDGQSPPVVHNAFLLIAAETGLVGLTAFLAFLAILLVQALRIVDLATNDTVWVAGVGIFSAFVALTVHSMADYALLGSLQVFTQFWLLAGLSAALSQGSHCGELYTRRVSYSSGTQELHNRSIPGMVQD